METVEWSSKCRRKIKRRGAGRAESEEEEEEEEPKRKRLTLLRSSIVYIDHYRTKEREPVIRIFGRTKEEVSVCIHVHECYPYFFVKAARPDFEFVAELRAAVEKSKFGRVLHDLSLCKGIDFYGYKEKVEAFVKIEINAPSQLSAFGQFLQSGNHELQTSLQPYETHIPYVLQFLSDYELSGMGFIELGSYVLVEEENRQTLRCERDNRLEIRTSVHDILVPKRELEDMRVPSLKSWVEELRENIFENSESYSHSPSLGSQRESVSQRSNIQLKQELFRWLEETSGDSIPQQSSGQHSSSSSSPRVTGSASDQSVSTQEALNILKSFENEGQSLNKVVPDLERYSSSEDEGEDPGGEGENNFTQAELDNWHNESSSSANSSGQVLESQFPKPNDLEKKRAAGDPPPLTSQTPNKRTPTGPNAEPLWSPSNRASLIASGASPFRSTISSVSDMCLIRPLEEPPTREELNLLSERFANTQVHQKPYFSNPDDAKKERAVNRRAPKAWLHSKEPPQNLKLTLAEQSEQRSVVLTPKEFPPSFQTVLHTTPKPTAQQQPKKEKKKPFVSFDEKQRQEEDEEGNESQSLTMYVKNDDDELEDEIEDPVLPYEEKDENVADPEEVATSKVQQTQNVGIEKVDTGARKLMDKKNAPALASFHFMIIEVIAKSSHKREPNPETDEVLCIYAAVYEDEKLLDSRQMFELLPKHEGRLLKTFAEYVQAKNPDAIGGWEIQRKSLGYLIHRANALKIADFAEKLSRVPHGPQDPRHLNDSYGKDSYSEFWLAGRHVFNIWRIVRGEIDLSSYSLENVCQDLFNLPIPKFSGFRLYDLFMRRSSRAIAMEHLVRVVDTVHRIVVHLDFLTKAGEFTKLLGLDLFSTMTRGSQFRVEGVMIRVAKPMNYVLPSPSRQQVATQPGLEYIALNLEPKSNLYCDPLAVLDFRSLYPSVIIAFNLCYSTYLGKIKRDGSGELHFEAGVFAHIRCDRGGYPSRKQVLKMIEQNQLFITPSGSVFVIDQVRSGVLPIMLSEILSTRITIQDGLKICKKQGRDAWSRVLNARQLALKLLANVTYGYTAASFSGRMPMSALADSIVSVAKDSLEEVMRLAISPEATWFNACPKPLRVVYGDTDSMFVLFPDCSLQAAFRIANNIAQQASMLFPNPMKLQMEKIYLPSMLVAKKRYCGMKYESPSEKPKIESKGLESIRRDSCPIMKRVMNDILMSIFTTRDLSHTKKLFQQHMMDILEQKISVKDFVFASKVKVPIEAKYRGPTLPPSAAVAKRLAAKDPMLMPVYKERVPYVIVNGPPAARLVDLVESPRPDSNVNVLYYIRNKIIRPLNRLFRLINVDAEHWYKSMNKAPTLTFRFSSRTSVGNQPNATKQGIHRHFQTIICFACEGKFAGHVRSNQDLLQNEFQVPLCPSCLTTKQSTALAVAEKERESERRFLLTSFQCRRCTGEIGLGSHCQNLSCPAYYAQMW